MKNTILLLFCVASIVGATATEYKARPDKRCKLEPKECKIASNEEAPTANFTTDVTNGNASLTVKFTDKSTGNPKSWKWDFNNDGKIDATVQNPTHTYSKPGIYSVKLTVSNSSGKSEKTEDDLIIVLAKITECAFQQSPAMENNFDNHNNSDWMFATWSFGGNATMFRSENGLFKDGKLNMQLKKENYNGKKYTGGHYQCHKGYGYGRYEIFIKAAKGGGLVSSFFLYSDHDKKEENGAKWHEIDFEFIHDPLNGNKPTLQFNYWNHSANHSGKSGNELRIVDKRVEESGLRDKYHKLTLDYTPKYIKWSVDDVPYHIVTENIPVSTTLKIMMNVWRPENSTHATQGVNWAGTVNDIDLPVTASYDYVKYYSLVSCSGAIVADFAADVTSGNKPLTVQFTDKSAGNPTKWAWDFGTTDITFENNTNANSQNPKVTFHSTGSYIIKLTVTNENGNNTKTANDYITVKSSTGIFDSGENIESIKIYPNPSKNFIYVESPTNEKVHIYNTNGKKLKTIILKTGKNELNISNLPTGVYILKVNKNNFKFVKQSIVR